MNNDDSGASATGPVGAGPADRTGDDDRDRFDRAAAVAREKERYGGVKVGSAFFGWLTATGTTVILLALLGAIAALIGLNNAGLTQSASNDAKTTGLTSDIILVVVLFIAYYCGGYVAGRMARFNGVKQGVAVWVWAIFIALVAAILGTIAGAQFNVLSQASFPSITVKGSDLTTAGIITLLLLVLAALAGAVLGGLAGMRFHRKVDRAGLDLH